MKNRTLQAVVMSGLLLAVATPTMAERIIYRDLPDGVRKSVQKYRDDIERIEKFSRDGQSVYEVYVERDGKDDLTLYFGEDGNRLNDPSLRNEGLAARGALKLNHLPRPVQTTFNNQAKGAKISEIEMDRENGRAIYEIEYTLSGRSDEIRIHEDGSLANAGTLSSKKSDEPGRRDESETAAAAGFDRPLAATRKVDFENLPEAVKRTARDVAGSNRIEDAEQGRLDGRTVYEIAFKKDGQHNELRVAEDGSIIQRVAGTNIRFPGSLSVKEVPAPVQRAIEEQVGSGEVNDIDKKNMDGRTVYEVGFKKESGGAQHEIRIAEDGSIVEPSGAEND